MATFTVTLTYVCTIEVEIPDSKIKSNLENGLTNVTDFAELKFENMPSNISCEVNDVDITVTDYSYITKDNQNDYEWDGEKLIRIFGT
jgi:hypothetical protein